MKSFIISTLLLFSAMTSFSQIEKNPYPRTITVSGSAEMEIVPDEIYVQVDLKEYEKKGQSKVSIDKIRQEFLGKAKSIGLPDSAITIASYDGSNEDEVWEKK